MQRDDFSACFQCFLKLARGIRMQDRQPLGRNTSACFQNCAGSDAGGSYQRLWLRQY